MKTKIQMLILLVFGFSLYHGLSNASQNQVDGCAIHNVTSPEVIQIQEFVECVKTKSLNSPMFALKYDG